MVLIERRSKTTENEWLSAVIVLAACFIVPYLDSELKWFVLAGITVPVVTFEAFKKKVREPVMGIWDEKVYFYRRGQLVASFGLEAISELKVKRSGINREEMIMRLADETVFNFDITQCRKPLRRAMVRCLHKHMSQKPAINLHEQAA